MKGSVQIITRIREAQTLSDPKGPDRVHFKKKTDLIQI
jgi:hypothetical protein